jgi:hypothetical protein
VDWLEGLRLLVAIGVWLVPVAMLVLVGVYIILMPCGFLAGVILKRTDPEAKEVKKNTTMRPAH